LEELDSQTIGRLHAMIEMRGVDESGQFAEARWKNISMSRDGRNKIYKKYPRRIQAGEKKRITTLRFSPPDPDVIEPYEKRKSVFQEEFYAETIEEIRDEDGDGDAEPEKGAKEVAKEVVEDSEGMEKYVSEHGHTGEPYFDKNMIRIEHDLTHSDAQTVKKLLEQRFDKEELERYV